MMAVNVYHACIVGIFTTRLRHLFVCGPRRAKNNSSCAAFRCAMARERDRAPQIRTTDTGLPQNVVPFFYDFPLASLLMGRE